ncbi:energy-coupling factor transporter transmembrane component T [Lentisphaerota bacterium ZTH]|nr:energy-coupling factor transporter transmembrane protein EcfT [Lentisphaerota bacterium]WET07309.1 energy-coupling factor transporter transmembrane component T [Lentisphaerota bacterium ZTH]
MSSFGTLYVDSDSFFHRMEPSLKVLIFALWSIVVFMFLDLRINLILLGMGALFLFFSKIPARIIRNLFIVVILFNLTNAVFIYLITPDYGTTLTGKSTVLLYNLTLETVFYIVTLSLKYLSLLPMVIILIFTTHPSRFASSLSKLGVPYKWAYTFNIIFRYIPDIQHEFKTIANAQAARGLSIKKDERSLLKRIRNLFNITIPLINSALARIDKVTNAMDLRGFGKHQKRTWYSLTPMRKVDYAVAVLALTVFALFLYFRITTTEKFWYPF